MGFRELLSWKKSEAKPAMNSLLEGIVKLTRQGGIDWTSSDGETFKATQNGVGLCLVERKLYVGSQKFSGWDRNITKEEEEALGQLYQDMHHDWILREQLTLLHTIQQARQPEMAEPEPEPEAIREENAPLINISQKDLNKALEMNDVVALDIIECQRIWDALVEAANARSVQTS